jgi:exodeoxyribonuclease VII small subunit
MENKKNFEQSMERLEEVVKALENGKVSLNEALSLFEEGISLSKYCEEELKNIEGKAAKILEGSKVSEFIEE